ncbi:protein of unknown function DUF47 [Desulforamulus reducens MI-1]|uniref:DUF47 domain-containing protein n=1 Tax=Desulforamulus reducens (strain ATCC BAA-1160 / DSM 100696 / MI-1) TaxID=349161 RepID=A4J7W0_DESRM|nr:DUF47 family protein [Desulforamulus reducens]ABO51163.1 protein of unknown function DUF47 [Desulforamulus reducens MI-1]
MFFKKTDIFFETFKAIAENITRAAEDFSAEIHNPSSDKRGLTNLQNYEKTGDRYTHTIIKELNKTFVTPLEREDIMNLAVKLDDILDGIEATMIRMDIYDIKDMNIFIKRNTEIILEQCQEVEKSIGKLVTKRFLEIRTHAVRINELENEADHLFNNSLRELVASCNDAIQFIKYKQIYEMLEEVTDACEDVANILESILMRNS